MMALKSALKAILLAEFDGSVFVVLGAAYAVLLPVLDCGFAMLRIGMVLRLACWSAM